MKKNLSTWLLVAALLLMGGVPFASADQILLRQSDGTMTPWGGVGEKGSVTCDNCSGGGGGAGSVTVASAVTTDTSTTPVGGRSGVKNFQWVVTGTGAVTQTATLKGSFDADGAYPTTICTLTVSGTAPVYAVCDPFMAPFPYLFVTTTSTTGTGASGTGRMGY